MTNRLWDKRIPTLLGISLITLSVILSSVFIKDQTIFKSSAVGIDDPRNITISNISDTSFVLSYVTEGNVTGTVNFGEDINLGITEIEDIDEEKGSVSPRMVHVTTLSNLAPSTKYYFVINSGQTTFLRNNVPFEVTTGPNISIDASVKTPIEGNVLFPYGSTPGQVIGYLTIKGAQTLSALVNDDGSFIFNLDSLRSEDVSSYFQLEPDTNLKITFVSDSLISRVLSLYNQTNPLPAITMSNNYDFTAEDVPTSSSSGGIGGFKYILPTLTLKQTTSNSPIILVPKKDQSFTNPQPQFRGTSLPNEKVEIIIHATETIIEEVKADNRGNWIFTPPATLKPGSHTLTIRTKYASGIVKTASQSFLVNAQANTILTPSPTITPTSTPIPTPIPNLFLMNQIPPTGNSSLLFIVTTAFAATAIGIVLSLITRSKASIRRFQLPIVYSYNFLVLKSSKNISKRI